MCQILRRFWLQTILKCEVGVAQPLFPALFGVQAVSDTSCPASIELEKEYGARYLDFQYVPCNSARREQSRPQEQLFVQF